MTAGEEGERKKEYHARAAEPHLLGLSVPVGPELSLCLVDLPAWHLGEGSKSCRTQGGDRDQQTDRLILAAPSPVLGVTTLKAMVS